MGKSEHRKLKGLLKESQREFMNEINGTFMYASDRNIRREQEREQARNELRESLREQGKKSVGGIISEPDVEKINIKVEQELFQKPKFVPTSPMTVFIRNTLIIYVLYYILNYFILWI